MKKEIANKYDEIFDSNDKKAKAFDLIAQEYYYGNFGKMQKSDFEVLMFSIYLDSILEKEETNMNAYSDYELSKQLGITQSRVSNLKVKKQLSYPYKNFDWKKSFERLLENARFSNGKIMINIPDKNLFLEVKNAIEVNGGYVEKQLTSSLLQIPVEYYLDLVLSVSEESEKKEILKRLNKYNQEEKINIETIKRKSINDIMQGGLREVFKEVTLDFVRKKSSSLADLIEAYFNK